MLSYEDQPSCSLRSYDRVLEIDPANSEAERNVIRVQSWRGRQRTSQRLARAYLRAHPGDPTVTATLAQSELWLGRPDDATRVDRELLGRNPSDASALSLAGSIADARLPEFRFLQSIGTQSDGLIIKTTDVEGDVVSANGLSTLGFVYVPIAYVGQGITGDAVERRVGVAYRERFDDSTEIHATASNDEISAAGTAGHNRLLYDTYVTFWPSDSLRFDAGAREETFDNVTSLRMGITGSFQSLSADYTPDENDRLTFRGNIGTFTDGNRRQFQQVEYERLVDRTPRALFGVRATDYSFALPPGPRILRPAAIQLDRGDRAFLYGDLMKRFYYDGSAAYGREWVLNGGTRPTHSVSGVDLLRPRAFAESRRIRQLVRHASTKYRTAGSLARRSVFDWTLACDVDLIRDTVATGRRRSDRRGGAQSRSHPGGAPSKRLRRRRDRRERSRSRRCRPKRPPT